MSVDRRTYIGGSTASKLMGENDYQCQRDVWDYMRGDLADSDISHKGPIQRGVWAENEKVIPALKEQGILPCPKSREVFDNGEGHDGQIFLRHPEHPRMGGHPDGIYWNGNAFELIEIKAPASGGVKRIKREGLPRRYYWQVVHYAMIMQATTGEVPIVTFYIWDCDTWDYFEVAQPIYKPDIDLLYETEQDFLFSLDRGIPPAPPPSGNKSHFETINDEHLNGTLIEYVRWKEVQSAAKEKLGQLKAEILSYAHLEEKEQRLVTQDAHAVVKTEWGPYDANYVSVKKREE